jgi:hypothetical protein
LGQKELVDTKDRCGRSGVISCEAQRAHLAITRVAQIRLVEPMDGEMLAAHIAEIGSSNLPHNQPASPEWLAPADQQTVV